MYTRELSGIMSKVPVRIWDIGGWLDTWFAVFGEVLNITVFARLFGSNGPFRGVETILETAKAQPGQGVIEIIAADPVFDVGEVRVQDLKRGDFDRSNILLAVLFLLKERLEASCNYTFRIMSPFLPGASVGTSAAVEISVGKALTVGKIPADELATIGWRAETEIKGGQSGVQDQQASAHSPGVGLYLLRQYPQVDFRPVPISESIRKALNQGLVTVCYGKHDSSEMHQRVISELEDEGSGSPRLAKLRGLAIRAEQALLLGDLGEFGRIAVENTEAQRCLYNELISEKAESVIQTAQLHKARGWKVNGAGGNGGSISVLLPSRASAEDFVQDVQKYDQSDWMIFEHLVTM